MKNGNEIVTVRLYDCYASKWAVVDEMRSMYDSSMEVNARKRSAVEVEDEVEVEVEVVVGEGGGSEAKRKKQHQTRDLDRQLKDDLSVWVRRLKKVSMSRSQALTCLLLQLPCSSP
jgi:hypothetical protein